MAQTINVHFLPLLATPEQLAGKTVVVIDVLRATTTIVQALAAGAKEVIPCRSVAEARNLAENFKGLKVLGGERDGLKIEGFDLGNSPAEYTAEVVKRTSVFFTTTNGTQAMMACKQSRRVLLGAFTNLSNTCHALSIEEDVDVLCSGTDGQITREDVLLAGAFVEQLGFGHAATLNDQAGLAFDAWRGCMESSVPLERLLLATQGGRNLARIGQASDIGLAAQIDSQTIVAVLLLKEWKIVKAQSVDPDV